jgi:DNA-binding MarR family transcriptional regulator
MPSAQRDASASQPRSWTFLSNHGHVLVALKESPDARVRELAERVGISERAIQLIVGDLERDGYVLKRRSGRRNHYTVTVGQQLRHPAERECSVDDLLSLFGAPEGRPGTPRP